MNTSSSAAEPIILPLSVRIGWIGTGVMGAPMCEHLLRAGYALTVHTRTPSKAQMLLDQGARWAESTAALVAEADVVCTMVGFPQDVRKIYLQPEGLLSQARSGQVFVDFTTSEPTLARELASLAASKSASVLDAPVSGGDVGAKDGTLSIMVGGDSRVFEAVKPILSVFGRTLVYQGQAGCGQHAKLCNQITIAGTMIGVCEALLYAHKAGLDGETLLHSISSGAAGCWTLDHLAPRILKRDFGAGFFVEHFIKDMGMALDEAKRMGLLLTGLSLVRKLYVAIQANGHGRSGTHALLLALEDLSPTFITADSSPRLLSK
ncbi:NAD(P)-dependent oxidoreductase [uncultured Nitrospira sp.]|uniref:NAD(P)-dependent oxidoreductase n=1 Tax=uncultured Nitrospira sp. TaxID=157176 RepID=UPI0031405F09